MRLTLSPAVLLATVTAASLHAQDLPSSPTSSSSPITIGETVRIQSRALGEGREAMVYLPRGYAAGRGRYPVVYVLDGESAFLHTAAAAAFLAEFGRMPEAIVVGVRNTDRGRDFTPRLVRTSAPPPGMGAHGGADAFLDFLERELIPHVDARYRTEPMRVLVGHSLGGLLTVHALAARPALFRGYLTLEPSLWWDGRARVDSVAAFFRARPDYVGRLAMVEGMSDEGWRPDWPRLQPAAPRGLRWSRVDVEDEPHEMLGYRGAYEGLKQLFADYLPEYRHDEAKATLDALEAQYARLSAEYGYAVPVPEDALLGAAARQAGWGRHGEAVRLLERAAALYPASTAARARLDEARRALQAAGDAPAPLPLLAALRPVSARDAAPFLGVWEGTEKVEPGRPLELVVTFAAAGDTLAGSSLVRGVAMDGGDLRLVHHGHAVRGNVIEWYRINRGGGVYVYRAELRGDGTLVGGMELRDGPPTVTLTLRRRTDPR